MSEGQLREPPKDTHEEDECLLCIPAMNMNAEVYTMISIMDPMNVPFGEDDADHLVTIPVCLGHYEAIKQYQSGKTVGEISL